VRADLLARVGALEENAARDASGREVLAVLRRGVVDVHAFAVQVDEDEVVVLGRDAVLGEDDAAAIKVEVGPREARGFVDSRSFAMKETIKDAVLERLRQGRPSPLLCRDRLSGGIQMAMGLSR
jgi:hypothetical protein